MSKRTVTTSHSDILEYWLQHREGWGWPRWHEDVTLTIYTCFACGFSHKTTKAQRHHVIPYRECKTDDPSAIHLLCSRCHGEAPEVPISAYRLWLRTHPHYLDILMKAVQDATTRLGLTEREQELICQLDRNARVAPLQALNGGFYDRIPRDTMAEFLLTELRKMIAL